ncbi:hypothetical protein C1645_733574 [Glomus cerebriforme]|uniref:Uncharacterized protein n=1 Tax=Glomus cerebriforme TaxID=658196 RepID=A0A397THZ8_9GLOM|nr:hypothetical protein C1645_733574 [Glomus cerebriforme]
MSNKLEEKNLESKAPFKWSKESDEELKRLKEESRASINWAEVAKWDAEGRPYKKHEEILMFLNKTELTSLGSNERRKYEARVTKLNSVINVYDIISKRHNIYALVLSNGQYVILRHLRDIWFRVLTFFTDYVSYSNFLCVYYTNRIMFPK